MIVKPGRLLDSDLVAFSSGAAAPLLLDTLPGATFAYSTRLLRNAYAGKCMNVRRSSDSATQDIGFDGSGNFDAAAFNSFVGGGNGFCAKWYDQSGNGNDVAQPTAAQQSQIVLSVQNGHPIIRMTITGTSGLTSSATVLVSQPFVGACVSSRRDTTNQYTAIYSDVQGGGPHGAWFGFVNTASKVEALSINQVQYSGVTENAFHSMVALFSGASATVNVDGGEVSGALSSGAGWLNSAIYIGWDPPSGDHGDNDIGEVIVWPSSVSRTTIITNLRAYWGTP